MGVVVAAVKRIAVVAPGAIIISGGAAGVDTWAEEAARACGLTCKVIRPDWNKHGKVAGLLRNTEIVESASHVLAFWNGSSTGTQDSVRKATDRGIPVKMWIEES